MKVKKIFLLLSLLSCCVFSMSAMSAPPSKPAAGTLTKPAVVKRPPISFDPVALAVSQEFAIGRIITEQQMLQSVGKNSCKAKAIECLFKQGAENNCDQVYQQCQK